MRHKAILFCQAPKPGESRLLMAAAPVLFEASAAGEQKLPRFTMTAYTGGPMRTGFSMNPVVVDLQGLHIPSQTLPIRFQHDARSVVGHSDSIAVENGQIKATGLISLPSTPEGAKVVEGARNGFPWQASIGAEVLQYEYVKEGMTARVNGQTVAGPVLLITKSTLNEISFVDLGADRKTSANVAAAAPGIEGESEGSEMNFNEWLKAKGFDPEGLKDEQRKSLLAMYETEQKALEASADSDLETQGLTRSDEVAAVREQQALETERIGAIRAACGGKHPKIEAQAIRDGWNVDRTSLEVMRAERPTVPNVISLQAPEANGAVLEAAIAKAGKLANIEKAYPEKDLEAADKLFKGGVSLQQLLLTAAWASGYGERFVTQSGMRDLLKAAFSTLSLPGILSNAANKFLLEGWAAVESVWREISVIRAVSDFKTVTRYRLTGAMQYEKVGPTGELKHGALSEEIYTNKADTYGIMFGIGRQDIINDDLGALTDIPRRIGRGGALKLNDIFWAAFLDNAAFFTTDRKNYQAGAGTALGIDGLTAGELLFANQVDPDGKPLALMPSILLVPNALKIAAKQLMVATELRDPGAKSVTTNPFAGQFRPISSAYLGNSAYPGYSTKAWYLLANPAELAAMEVAFLNGQESPTVESADADFHQLGIQMRGYHDFGVTKSEYRAGVKLKGEA